MDFDKLVSRREVLAEALAIESTLDPSQLFIPHSVVIEDPDTGDIGILGWYAHARGIEGFFDTDDIGILGWYAHARGIEGFCKKPN